jgi:hypothetical protein
MKRASMADQQKSDDSLGKLRKAEDAVKEQHKRLSEQVHSPIFAVYCLLSAVGQLLSAVCGLLSAAKKRSRENASQSTSAL